MAASIGNEARQVSATEHNCAVAWTPFPVTVLRPSTPHSLPGDPIISRSLWRDGDVRGIRALKKLGGGGGGGSSSASSARLTGTRRGPGGATGVTTGSADELLVVSGHSLGHLMLLNAENYNILKKTTHYNQVNIGDIAVTKSFIYTLVTKDLKLGKAGDDSEVFVWDIKTFELACTLSAHDERVTSIAVDEKDECRCATGGVDKTIYLWKFDKETCIKEEPRPVAKLQGHQMSVTNLLISRSLLISSSADSSVKIWDLNTQTCIKEFDGHQGSVSFMSWVSIPRVLKKESSGKGGSIEEDLEDQQFGDLSNSAAAQQEKALKQKDHGAEGSFISACATGIVRQYYITGHSTTLLWSNKAHKGMTTDVVWDDDTGGSGAAAVPTSSTSDSSKQLHKKEQQAAEKLPETQIVASSSASDGITFFNLRTKQNSKYTMTEGVRQLAIDKTRRLLLAGSDAGQLVILNYNGLVSPSAASEGIRVVTTIQPHTGSVTSLVLERSGNGQWERVLSASNDRSMFVLDFNVDRDAKIYQSGATTAKSLALCERTGTAITASDSWPTLWDTVEMIRKADAKQNQVLQSGGHRARTKITSLKFSQELGKLITGGEDGMVKVWDVDVTAEQQPAASTSLTSSTTTTCGGEETITLSGFIDLSASVKCLSEPMGSWIGVGAHKSSSLSKIGSVSVIDLNSLKPISASLPTTVFPVDVRLHVYIHPETKTESFILLAQLRNGEVMMFSGNATSMVVLRSVLKEHFSYSLEREHEIGGSPFPVAVTSNVFISSSVARMKMLFVDSSQRTVRCSEMTTLPGDNTSNLVFSTSFDSVVNDVAEISQGKSYCAVATESSSAYILDSRGDYLMEITYFGSCIDIKANGSPLGLTSSSSGGGSERVAYYQENQHQFDKESVPGCCCIAVSEGARVVAFGYRDGCIQLWDYSKKKICRRIHAHSPAAVSKIWILPGQLRLASMSITGSLRFDKIYQRNVRDALGSSPSGVFSQPSRSGTPTPPPSPPTEDAK